MRRLRPSSRRSWLDGSGSLVKAHEPARLPLPGGRPQCCHRQHAASARPRRSERVRGLCLERGRGRADRLPHPQARDCRADAAPRSSELGGRGRGQHRRHRGSGPRYPPHGKDHRPWPADGSSHPVRGRGDHLHDARDVLEFEPTSGHDPRQRGWPPARAYGGSPAGSGTVTALWPSVRATDGSRSDALPGDLRARPGRVAQRQSRDRARSRHLYRNGRGGSGEMFSWSASTPTTKAMPSARRSTGMASELPTKVVTVTSIARRWLILPLL